MADDPHPDAIAMRLRIALQCNDCGELPPFGKGSEKHVSTREEYVELQNVRLEHMRKEFDNYATKWPSVSAACRLTIEQETQLTKMLNHEKRKKFLERLKKCEAKPKHGHHLTHYHVAIIEARVGGKALVDLQARNGDGSQLDAMIEADLLESANKGGGGATADKAGFRYHRSDVVRANGAEAVKMMDNVFSEKLGPEARHGWLFLYDLFTGVIGLSFASEEESERMEYPLKDDEPKPDPKRNSSAVADWRRHRSGQQSQFFDWLGSATGHAQLVKSVVDSSDSEPLQAGPRGSSGSAALTAVPKLLFQSLWVCALKGGCGLKYKTEGPMWQLFSILSHAYDQMMDQQARELGVNRDIESAAKRHLEQQLASLRQAIDREASTPMSASNSLVVKPAPAVGGDAQKTLAHMLRHIPILCDEGHVCKQVTAMPKYTVTKGPNLGRDMYQGSASCDGCGNDINEEDDDYLYHYHCKDCVVIDGEIQGPGWDLCAKCAMERQGDVRTEELVTCPFDHRCLCMVAAPPWLLEDEDSDEEDDESTFRRLANGTPVSFGTYGGCTVVKTHPDGSVDVDVPGPGVERHVARSRVSPLDGSSNEVDAEPSTAGLASARIAGKAFPVMLRISPDGSLAWVRTAIDAGDVQMASPSAIRASFDVQDTPDAQVRIHLAGVRMRRPPPQPPAGGTDQARKLAITATSSVSTPLETAAGPRQRRAHLTYGPNVGGPGVSPSSAAAEAAPAPAPRAQSGMRRLPDGTHISYSSYSGCTIVRTNPDGSVDVDIPGPGVERNVARSRVSPLDGSSNTAELEPLGSVEWVPPIVAPLQTSVSVQEPPSEWACARCTLVNQASNAKCEACDADRPPREVLPPDKSAGGKDVTEEARYLPAEAAKQGDFGYMRGVVLKRTEDGHDVAVWRPGDVICRLDRNLRPRQKTSSVVLAGAAHGLRGVITAIKKQRSDQHRQEETERQLREERLEARRKHRTQRRRFRRMLSDPSTVRTELPNSFEEILNDMPDHAAVVSLITRNADRLIQLRLFESSTGISVAFTEVIKKAVEFVDDEFAAPIFRALLPPLLTRICAPQPEYVTVNQAVGALHWLAHNANLLDDSGVKAAFFPYRVQLSTALVAYSDNPLAAREGFAEPHAHAPLVRHPDEAVDTDFICDHCHQDMVGLRMRFTCPAGCDFDACEACFVKIYGDGASRLEPDGIIAGEGEFGCDLCGHEHIDASINCIEMYRWVLSRLV